MVGFRRLHTGFGVVGVVLASVGWTQGGWADSFYLTTGEVIEGDVIQATRNSVTIRAGSSVRPTSLSLIEKVVVKLADGSELSGELLDWDGGVVALRSADVVFKIEDGRILEEESETAAIADAGDGQRNDADKVDPIKIQVVQREPEITLSDGRILSGDIIHGTGSIVTIRLNDGGVVPATLSQIGSMAFTGVDGKAIVGDFVDWSAEVYKLRQFDRDIFVSADEGVVEAGLPPAFLNEVQNTRSTGTVIESADAAMAPDSGASADQQNDPPARLPAPEVTPPGSDARSEVIEPGDEIGYVGDGAGAGGPRLVESTVLDVDEGGEAVVFEFHLSHPPEQPLVILYAATGDTAKAGEDFEAKSGVVTFDVGSTYAEVRVPLINDDQSEDSEQFQLFLSGDPKIVKFSQRQIVATITDDD